MAEKPAGHILIECPNTIFHLYARDEGELSKIETFLLQYPRNQAAWAE